MKKYTSVDEYINDFSGDTKQRLKEVRKAIKDVVPEATERISYNIAGYFLGKQRIIYFAGFTNHISIYPFRVEQEPYVSLLSDYASGKATVKFSNTKPLPIDIIKESVRLRLAELGEPKASLT